MSISAGADLAEAYGIETDHERMPNGDLRFRMYGRDGNGYVRTISGPVGAWQNSHFHQQIRETFIVEIRLDCVGGMGPGRTWRRIETARPRRHRDD